MHDSQWTDEDRTVACKQLGHGNSVEFFDAHELYISDRKYQPSRRVAQCNGSEGRLIDCTITNHTSPNPAILTVVFVNCTNETLHSISPSSSTESETGGPPSETAIIGKPSKTISSKPSSPVLQPSQSPGDFILRETSKTERVTSSSYTRHTPPPDQASSPPQKAMFLTPLISGILGGFATLIGVTVVILGIFIVATRTKVCRTSKRKRNSDDYSGTGKSPLCKENPYTQPRKDATNPHNYAELEHLYDVVHEPPKPSAQGRTIDTVNDNPEPYLVFAKDVETGAQYASLERSRQYATLEAFTGHTVPASSGTVTTPNGTYSHLNHGTLPRAPPIASEHNSGDPFYSEIPVRLERTVTMNNSVKDQEMRHSENGKYGAPHEYAVLEPNSTEWEIDDLGSTQAESLYQKHSLNTAGQPLESDRTSSELSTSLGTDV